MCFIILPPSGYFWNGENVLHVYNGYYILQDRRGFVPAVPAEPDVAASERCRWHSANVRCLQTPAGS